MKVAKEVVKRTPPHPYWREPGYIPSQEELQVAQEFPIHVMTDDELVAACAAKERLVFDIETYPNYFCICFISLKTGWVWFTEMFEGQPLDIQRFGWVLTNFTIVGYNSISFDIPIASLALAGLSCSQIKEASNLIITEEWRPSDVLKKHKVKSIKQYIDHIDLIEVAPGVGASLKIYGGRMHCPRMQDLPFHHACILTREQMTIVRWYCVNDLVTTAFMHEHLKEQLTLREQLGKDYGIDLRSKSDAQIAEAVIVEEVERLNGSHPRRPDIPVGTVYRYHVPQFLRYESQVMQWALYVVASASFVVADHGSIEMPREISQLKLTIANSTYTMGIGGLHSTESRVAHLASEDIMLIDRDVASYYPEIILNLQLFPQHLGRNFLSVYRRIVDRRLEAKRQGDKVVADSLKITVNGSFGKLGSKYSMLYSPDLLIQVTITGQLALLMLIERLEMRDINVVSANTDGVVIKCQRSRKDELNWVINNWENETGFQTEESQYSAYYARDVNSYIAVKVPDKAGKVGTKTKGAYAPTGLQKNPTNRICIDAVEALLIKNIPIHETIRSCTDIKKFISVRKVKGGAVKDCTYLGVSIRWYYATSQSGEIVYANSGNKVPRSDGAKPLMDLPLLLPDDINYEWYEAEANKILTEIAYRKD